MSNEYGMEIERILGVFGFEETHVGERKEVRETKRETSACNTGAKRIVKQNRPLFVVCMRVCTVTDCDVKTITTT